MSEPTPELWREWFQWWLDNEFLHCRTGERQLRLPMWAPEEGETPPEEVNHLKCGNSYYTLWFDPTSRVYKSRVEETPRARTGA